MSDWAIGSGEPPRPPRIGRLAIGSGGPQTTVPGEIPIDAPRPLALVSVMSDWAIGSGEPPRPPRIGRLAIGSGGPQTTVPGDEGEIPIDARRPLAVVSVMSDWARTERAASSPAHRE